MPVGTNLERRGAVYYWRRRIPHRLVGMGRRSHLRMSLRTKEPAQARALAAHLDAAAMDVFMSADAPALSQQQLEAIFQRALRDHASKLDILRAMNLRDGLTDPDTLAKEDRTAGFAYALLARRGSSATVNSAERELKAANGKADAMIEAVATFLEEMRRNGHTNASVGRLTTLIEAVGALATPANVAIADRAYLQALGQALLGSATAFGTDPVPMTSSIPQESIDAAPAARIVFNGSVVVADQPADAPPGSGCAY